MAVTGTTPRVASPLGYLLRVARLAASRLVTEEGLTGAEAARELAILATLAEGPSSQQQLADHLGINRSVMVKLIDLLEQHGRVVRARNSSDRRSYALAVTSTGLSRREVLSSQLAPLDADLARQLSGSERRQLGQLLASLLAEHHHRRLPAALAESLVFEVIAAQEAIQVAGDLKLAPLGIDVRTYVSLAIVAGQPCSQITLASHLFIGPAATVDLVDLLEEKGAARRLRNPEDRRSHIVEATPAGLALLEQAREVIRAATSEFTECLGAGGGERLVTLLQKMLAATVPG